MSRIIKRVPPLESALNQPDGKLKVEEYDFDLIVDALRQNGYEVIPKSRIKLIWQQVAADLSHLRLIEEYEQYMRRNVEQAFGYKISQELKLKFIQQDDPWSFGIRRYFSAVKVIELTHDELLRVRAVAAPLQPPEVRSESPPTGLGDPENA